MTLNNKNWVKNEVLRLYLSGDSQENIAKELNISVGTCKQLLYMRLFNLMTPLTCSAKLLLFRRKTASISRISRLI